MSSAGNLSGKLGNKVEPEDEEGEMEAEEEENDNGQEEVEQKEVEQEEVVEGISETSDGGISLFCEVYTITEVTPTTATRSNH